MPLGGQTSSAPCQETPVVINCETEGEVCAGATCVPCLPAEPVAPLCSGAELAALPQELADLDQLMTHTGANDLLFPIVLYRLRFCDGSRRYVFDRELGGIDADYVMEQRLIVRSAADLYRLTYNNGASGQIGAVDVILSQRPGNNGLLITPLPPLQQSSAPGDPLSGDNPGNEGDGRPQMSYYNYDHLGNTRVVYHSVINCVSDSVHYVLEYAADYYPFGSILREWSNCEKSRFLFTYKERDAETGWDNLGARLYDSDIGRFLGVDPIADQFPHVNSYNYAENNPVVFIDLHGLQASPPIIYLQSSGRIDPKFLDNIVNSANDFFKTLQSNIRVTTQDVHQVNLGKNEAIAVIGRDKATVASFINSNYCDHASQDYKRKLKMWVLENNKLNPEKSEGNDSRDYSEISPGKVIIGGNIIAISLDNIDELTKMFNGKNNSEVIAFFIIHGAGHLSGLKHPQDDVGFMKGGSSLMQDLTGYDGYYMDIDTKKYHSIFDLIKSETNVMNINAIKKRFNDRK